MLALSQLSAAIGGKATCLVCPVISGRDATLVLVLVLVLVMVVLVLMLVLALVLLVVVLMLVLVLVCLVSSGQDATLLKPSIASGAVDLCACECERARAGARARNKPTDSLRACTRARLLTCAPDTHTHLHTHTTCS